MFGGMKKSDGIGSDDIETIIGKNTQLKGTLGGKGNIRIDGKLEGEIAAEGDVVIGEQGQVIANVKAHNVLISGSVQGNISIDGKLEILGSGRLCGDVKAKVLSIAEGALFKGSSLMESPRHIAADEATAALEKKHK